MKTNNTSVGNLIKVAGVFLLFVILSSGRAPAESSPPWGFFGHRLINRMAVFTLPPELIVFYKKNLSYISEHAVDPDKRRYATRHEAVRHYIDLDQWGKGSFDHLPKDWTGVLMQYASLVIPISGQDTLFLTPQAPTILPADSFCYQTSYRGILRSLKTSYPAYHSFFMRQVLPQYYEDEWKIPLDSFSVFFAGQWPLAEETQAAWVLDGFSQHGILPYFLPQIQRQLTEAFRKKDIPRILRLSAEIGHYIGDAHVPLHTTKNYNGQLTSQTGIHAFWESRLPELFAEGSYDFFVGNAEYFSDPRKVFWDIVLESHSLVDTVLSTELALSKSYPSDQQFCFEERLGTTVRTQCFGFSKAYHDGLSGMVENRMKQAIRMIGSAWYTAWIDAGQPKMPGEVLSDLFMVVEKQEEELLEQSIQKGKQQGRPHDTN